MPHICLLPAAAMANSRQPAAAKKKRVLEQPFLPDASSETCRYLPVSPVFDPQRLLLRRLFFINSDRTKYLFFGFYPVCDNQPLVEFGAIRWGGSKSIVPKDEDFDTQADCLPKMLVSMCNGGGTGAAAAAVVCESGAFRLSPPKNYGSPRVFLHAVD